MTTRGTKEPFERRFEDAADRLTNFIGSARGLLLGIVLFGAWVALGPLLNFDERWPWVLGGGAAIVTLLLVFLVQANENRHSRAIQLKLDELIRATEGARNELAEVEHETLNEIERHRQNAGPGERRNAP